MKNKLAIIFTLVAMLCTAGLQAQELPERGLVRRGNKEFKKGNYAAATERYMEALEKAPTSNEAMYNLGNTLYKSALYEEAEKALATAAADTLLQNELRAEALYNLGNVYFDQQKLEEALGSYRASLRLNSQDRDARFNYFLTKKLLEQQQENEDENQDENEDENEDENQDEQDENQDGENEQDGDQNQDEQDGDNDQNDGGEDEQNGDQQEQEQPQQPQPQEGGMSQQEQQQLLDAIQAQEDKTQEKLEEEEARAVQIRGVRNW